MKFLAIFLAFWVAMEIHAEDSLFQMESRSLSGEPVFLSDYDGKVALVINVASRCGFAAQYTGLEKLYADLKDKGFVILAFPSNDFGGQEPGTPAEIAHFCAINYHVSFPMFEKVHVKGSDKNPIFSFCTEKFPEPSWNFCKYLIGKDGKVAKFFDSNVCPDDPRLMDAIQAEMNKKVDTDVIAADTPTKVLTSAGVNLHSGHVFNVKVAYDGAVLSMTITDSTDNHFTMTKSFPLDNLPSIVFGNTAYMGFTASTGNTTCVADITSWNYIPGNAADAPPLFNMEGNGPLPVILNGSAKKFGRRFRLTDGAQDQASSMYYEKPVNIQSFITTFSFQLTDADADGLTFVIQGEGPQALGAVGGGLGYSGITRSVAVKFDLFDDKGEGNNSTGLFENGADPFVPAFDLMNGGEIANAK